MQAGALRSDWAAVTVFGRGVGFFSPLNAQMTQHLDQLDYGTSILKAQITLE